jgi:hypothetical protein
MNSNQSAITPTASAAATPSIKKEVKNFRERTHRVSNLSVKEVMRLKMAEHGIKNVELQRELGFPTPNVISMMKSGSMRVPIQHAAKIATLFEIDKLAFLRKVVEENDPNLWDAMESAMGIGFSVSANESKLLNILRDGLCGFDLDLTKDGKFMSSFKQSIHEVTSEEITKKNTLLAKLDSAEVTEQAK